MVKLAGQRRINTDKICHPSASSVHQMHMSKRAVISPELLGYPLCATCGVDSLAERDEGQRRMHAVDLRRWDGKKEIEM